MKRLLRGLIRTAAKEVLKQQVRKVIVKAVTPKPVPIRTPQPAPKVANKVAPKVVPKAVPKPTPRKEQSMKTLLIGALRHGLQLGAGALVAKGVVDAAGAELVIGVGVSAFTLGWYLLERKVPFLKV